MSDITGYYRAEELGNACAELLKHRENAAVIAGGTDLLVNLRARGGKFPHLIDIKHLTGLNIINYSAKDGLEIGAAVTINQLIASETVQKKYPILSQAARSLATPQVRNRATVAGNLCNASPAADMAPPLLVLGAALEICSQDGYREVPLSGFFKGVKETVLAPGEIVTKIKVPAIEGQGVFLKKTRVKGHDLSIVSAAVFWDSNKRLQIAFGAADKTPVLISETWELPDGPDEATKKQIIKKVMERAHPISDLRASKEYREAMLEYLTDTALSKLFGGGENAAKD